MDGVLLEKMKYFGFRTSAIKWFESYLSDRQFLVYIDTDTCIFYQHEDVNNKIENVLNKQFSSLCLWFTDNKPSIPFGEDKTKSILFTKTKRFKKGI